MNGGTTVATLTIEGSYTSSSFKLANDGSGHLLITDPPADSGTLTVDTGATMEIGAASTATVDFANTSGTTGSLVLDDSKDFTGQIVGFAGDGTVSNSDAIDLKDINFATATETYTENSAGTGGTLTVSDGTNSANINFTGDYVLGNFIFASDGQGGTLIMDPPVDGGNSISSSDGLSTNAPRQATLDATEAAGAQTAVTSVTVEDGTVVALNITALDDAASVTISGLPSDVTLTDSAGDTLTVSNGTITLTKSELTGLALHTSGQDEIITLSVTATNSGDGWTATKTLVVDVSSHTTHWETGSDGEWTTASSWTWSGPSGPTSSDDALIDASGVYTVSIDSPDVAHSLTINDAGATVVDSASLSLSSALTVDAGVFELAGGTLEAGSIFGQVSGYGAVSGTIVTSAMIADSGGSLIGSLTIDSGAVLELQGSSAENVTFANNAGDTGTLVLDDPTAFSGQISAFTGTSTISDAIDLKGIDFNSGKFVDTYANGVLTVSDGTNTVQIQFTGPDAYTLANFKFASDGNGGTLVTDPPTGGTQAAPETFTFQPPGPPSGPAQQAFADLQSNLLNQLNELVHTEWHDTVAQEHGIAAGTFHPGLHANDFFGHSG